MILPGETLGVIGGGQLGRMFTVEALRMGYDVVVLDPDANSPAGQLASHHICATYDDTAALDDMARRCRAITIEFENLPLSSLTYLDDRVTLSPSPRCVEIAQNRLLEKNFFSQHGLATAAFAPLQTQDDIDAAVAVTGLPCIVKTAQFGYDGKGQRVCHSRQDVAEAFEQLGQVACIVEQKITLTREVSVILARSRSGVSVAFPIAENTHENGILDTTVVPAHLEAGQADQARALANQLADALDYIGVLAVEMFVNDDNDILLNEIAPRPHNSGHFTLDATQTSQFEQQVRMLCDLPAGSVALDRPVVMLNLLGDLWGDTQPQWQTLYAEDSSYLHLYGKKQALVGRKMGHVNLLGDDRDQLLQRARDLKQALAS